MRKADAILAAALIVIGLAAMFLLGAAGGSSVSVRQNGRVIYEGSINTDKTVEVGGDYHNTIEIKNGEVRFTSSTCPGQDCVKSGSHKSGTIACAPNGVVVTIGSAEGKDTSGGEVDSVAQ